LSAIAINCSLKRSSDGPSSTDTMIDLIQEGLSDCEVAIRQTIRVADFHIAPGVRTDEGHGDEWPTLRSKILDADILVFGTPIWMGQPSSIAKRVLERMDAFFGEIDDVGRSPATGKVAVAAIVGNEDGAHSVTASLFQALNDTGWTIPAMASCYWVGEAMHKTDFKDLKNVPKQVRLLASGVAANAAHLAALLSENQYKGRVDRG
jgi:multimeric flavodoxin WrbA